MNYLLLSVVPTTPFGASSRTTNRFIFLFATPPIHLADIRAIGGLADDLRTGTLDVAVSVAFPEDHARPGWTVAVRLTRVEEPGVTVAERSAEASALRPDLGRKATPNDIGAMHRRGAGDVVRADVHLDARMRRHPVEDAGGDLPHRRRTLAERELRRMASNSSSERPAPSATHSSACSAT